MKEHNNTSNAPESQCTYGVNGMSRSATRTATITESDHR